MTLRAGAHAWIPCRVARGLFPDDRNVWVDSPDGPWSGVVDLGLLREDIPGGETAVRVTIVGVTERGVSALLPGQTPRSRHLVCPVTWIQRFVSD
jgi:hypothetical protein